MSGFIMNLHLIVTIGLVIFPMSACSMRFDLRSGATKCISEDIKSKAMSVGKYSVVNPNEGFPVPDSHKITVRKMVNSPRGVKYHHGDHVEAGNFAFTGAEPGDYTACFWAPDHKRPVTVGVDFDWRTGVAATDWSNVAKKGQIEVMELELKKLHATVISIHDEIFYLREREEEMQLLNRATNSKMATFSFLSLVVCLSVAGLQLWHLKTFFERKKLL
ncbi:transmembrane emp24 domain-containing protein p24delta9-like isoform X1 [Juglans microcarpa x Juglans regia]|uniref:transmembrane emp24 domain-containing protein p24delta9-like isoform X1 n=1 Tax=Juglans microcarpa x Juglans regia TaxID=2249226 RepID=UPI001B7ECA90|nr:transmembrane emp24 domain-containing protein p24delta9-like isoform X1 [Juglans microcarpa x Juglans regia]